MYGKTRTGIGLPPLVDSEGVLLTPAARYADLVRQGRVFSAANQGAVATTAALATTWTGLGICNPVASTKDMVLLEFGAAQSLAGSTAGAIGLMFSDTTGLAADIATYNVCRGHSNTSVGIADAGATIATPILFRVYGQVGTVATSAYGVGPGLVVHLDGAIVLQPGTSLLTYTTLATTAALVFYFVWAELDRASDS